VVQLATGEEVNLKTDLARRIVGLAEEEPPGGRLLPGSRDEARPFGPAIGLDPRQNRAPWGPRRRGPGTRDIPLGAVYNGTRAGTCQEA